MRNIYLSLTWKQADALYNLIQLAYFEDLLVGLSADKCALVDVVFLKLVEELNR